MNTLSHLERFQPVAGKARALPGFGERSLTLLIRTWRALQWVLRRVRVQQARRSLRVCENVSLGDKRFVAVIQVDEERFLIGGSSSSMSLLSRLQEAKAFATDLDRETKKLS